MSDVAGWQEPSRAIQLVGVAQVPVTAVTYFGRDQEHGICLGRSDPKSPDFALFVRTELEVECTHSDRVPCFGGLLVRISYRTSPSIRLQNIGISHLYVRISSSSIWRGSHFLFYVRTVGYGRIGHYRKSPLLSRFGIEPGVLRMPKMYAS